METSSDDIQIDYAAEIDRCVIDPIYFINTYLKIVSIDKGVVPFKTYQFQEDFINLIQNNRFVTAMMARQMGKSTTVAALALWYMMFNPDKVVAILANLDKVAKEIINRLKEMYKRLPEWMQDKPKEWNKTKIVLSNGSVCLAGPATANSISGFTVSLLIIDEVAKVNKTVWDEFYESSYPTIVSGLTSKIVLISTPKGLNHFYEIHNGAKKADSNFKWIEAPWHCHPDRDEKWKAQTLSGMTGNKQRQFAQEFDITFHGSSKTLIRMEDLPKLVSDVPMLETEIVSIYEEPEKGQTYLITVDCSKGIGEDKQAFSIIKSGTVFDQVVTFADPDIKPKPFAQVLYRYGKKYNNAFVLIEQASSGDEVANELFEQLQYENVVFTVGKGGREEIGLVPTKKTKRVGCSAFKDMVEDDSIKIRCARTINEIRRFVQKNDSYAAETGCNDDLVIGLINFAYMTKQEDFMDTLIEARVKPKIVVEDEKYLLPVFVEFDTPLVVNRVNSSSDNRFHHLIEVDYSDRLGF